MSNFSCRSLLGLTRYDCARRRAGTLQMTAFAKLGGQGKELFSDARDDPKMNALPPGSPGAAVLDFVCAHG
jgi:hypothetical protein